MISYVILQYNQTALHLAARKNCVKTVLLLLNLGANVNAAENVSSITTYILICFSFVLCVANGNVLQQHNTPALLALSCNYCKNTFRQYYEAWIRQRFITGILKHLISSHLYTQLSTYSFKSCRICEGYSCFTFFLLLPHRPAAKLKPLSVAALKNYQDSWQ